MKLPFTILTVTLFILAATLATPSSACDYEINRACNLVLEKMECNRISESRKGVVYLNIRIQNKSDCQFDNVKIIYTLRSENKDVIYSDELDVGTLAPYENKVKDYRVKELMLSPGLKGITCDLALKG